MTKEHFEAIAAILKALGGSMVPEYRRAVKDVAEDMAKYFREENLRFDRERFLKACGF